MKTIKIIIEQHEDGFIGYPLGFTRGAIVGQGDTYEDALADTRSAIEFFIRHYGTEKFWEHIDTDAPLLNVFVAEAGMPT
jgi:predicted RNase H-like HicB family nuclease